MAVKKSTSKSILQAADKVNSLIQGGSLWFQSTILHQKTPLQGVWGGGGGPSVCSSAPPGKLLLFASHTDDSVNSCPCCCVILLRVYTYLFPMFPSHMPATRVYFCWYLTNHLVSIHCAPLDQPAKLAWSLVLALDLPSNSRADQTQQDAEGDSTGRILSSAVSWTH